MTRRRTMPALISDSEIFTTYEKSRKLLARLVNSSPAEIALAPNTSFGLNLAANALPLRAGDVVLTFEREFPANVYPWMALEKRGIVLRFIPCVNGLPDEDRLLEALDGRNVRAVAVSWVSFASGYRVDLARLGRECRSRGIFLVVDGIQGLGARALDLSGLQVDVFASGCQKWLLSPWGTGFVYVRSELVRELEPSDVGWLAMKGSDDFASLTDYSFEFRDDARRFEVGTLALQDFVAMNASVELILSLSPAGVERRVSSLAGIIADWGRSRGDVQLLSPANSSQQAGIVSLGLDDATRVAAALRAAKVAFSLREGALRFAPHFFNTEDEVARALEIAEQALNG